MIAESFTYKGHTVKVVTERCPKCNQEMRQMDDFPVIYCECAQYARRIDGMEPREINRHTTEEQLGFGW